MNSLEDIINKHLDYAYKNTPRTEYNESCIEILETILKEWFKVKVKK